MEVYISFLGIHQIIIINTHTHVKFLEQLKKVMEFNSFKGQPHSFQLLFLIFNFSSKKKNKERAEGSFSLPHFTNQ